MHIALYKPDIPQNTAAIIRLSACLNLTLHIIEPCGFNINDSRFKRVVIENMRNWKIYRQQEKKENLKKNKKNKIIIITKKIAN